ncbi:MAG: S8/S53 family peptidase, partial [Pseudomonadota bacterium]
GALGAGAGGGAAAAMGWWSWVWGARAAGQPAAAAEPAYAAADFTGAGQTIIVIDDGMSPFYDQSATVWSYDFSGANDADASKTSLYSHGDWVAQSALDEAPDVDIIHLKVFPDGGGGASLGDIEEALQMSIALTGYFDIAAVNLSLGFGNTTTETLTPLSDEFAMLDALGVISVAAAGNSGTTYDDGVNVLAADPNVVAVSAVDSDGDLASFSQRSDTLTDIAADGVNRTAETVWGGTVTVSGTSFAAPEVAGIAARLSEASATLLGEDLTDEELIDILNKSGSAVQNADAPYAVADGDAAVAYFIDNLEYYDDGLMIA